MITEQALQHITWVAAVYWKHFLFLVLLKNNKEPLQTETQNEPDDCTQLTYR
jgi:hypothetical protein